MRFCPNDVWADPQKKTARTAAPEEERRVRAERAAGIGVGMVPAGRDQCVRS